MAGLMHFRSTLTALTQKYFVLFNVILVFMAGGVGCYEPSF